MAFPKRMRILPFHFYLERCDIQISKLCISFTSGGPDERPNSKSLSCIPWKCNYLQMVSYRHLFRCTLGIPKNVIKENSTYWLPTFRAHNQLKVFPEHSPWRGSWLLKAKEFQMCWARAEDRVGRTPGTEEGVHYTGNSPGFWLSFFRLYFNQWLLNVKCKTAAEPSAQAWKLSCTQ